MTMPTFSLFVLPTFTKWMGKSNPAGRFTDGMAPSLTLASYRQIGVNAAGYALGHAVAPVPTVLDNYARAKLIVRTTLLHAREAAEVVPGAPPVDLVLISAPVVI